MLSLSLSLIRSPPRSQLLTQPPPTPSLRARHASSERKAGLTPALGIRSSPGHVWRDGSRSREDG